MAWWDYGYQINGIAERTTLADGNTWNHEHIALLGRALVSNEEIAWETTRHLADYVLCWSTRHSGSMGDDLAKMPHMARIAGSVYDDVNASDYYLINREGDLSNGIKQVNLLKNKNELNEFDLGIVFINFFVSFVLLFFVLFFVLFFCFFFNSQCCIKYILTV